MNIYTDMADELFRPGRGTVPPGVQVRTASSGPIRLTRVQITRQGLARPAGRYSTLETPSLAALDRRDERLISAAAAELRAMLPTVGLVLVVGVGNRRVTVDALGPRTAAGVLVTRGLAADARADGLGLREVVCVSPGASGATGIPLAQLLAGLVRTLKPAAIVCVDSLCTSDPARLGRTIQISDTGLSPARPDSGRCITRAMLGVPVLAVGVPTLMEADECVEGAKGLILTCRQLDGVIRSGSELLSAAINKALQPSLSIAELCYLAN
ncbi:GPR endopeptidase [Allofournierella massiliensis]|uniref:GPR endopeptidase n=1 Tax=Allofournierella massiliensis TaxID=1650663 RepID=UPI0024B0D38A|nr:GPR endopeptidase [Fournierella massiliensis]